jgi:uncharacterized membrane protein YdjX (TVP38/TMEM64 family)
MIKFNFKDKESLLSIALVAIVVCLTVVMFIDLFPLLKDIAINIKNEEELSSDIYDYGTSGAFIIVALQALQVITAFFPSAAIQILAGLTYGIFYGMLFCLAGYILGNALVFFLVRQMNKTFTLTFTRPKKRESRFRWDFSFLKDSDHVAVLVVALFLIPGIPNGILPYIFARTKISLPRYLLSIGIAGIPSILLCSSVGERIANGDILSAAILFGTMLLIVFVVLLSRNRIISLLKRISR